MVAFFTCSAGAVAVAVAVAVGAEVGIEVEFFSTNLTLITPEE